jgi:hypothetical protein
MAKPRMVWKCQWCHKRLGTIDPRDGTMTPGLYCLVVHVISGVSLHMCQGCGMAAKVSG